jgi:hypothetical protein
MTSNLKQVFIGAVEGILFCTAVLMLGVVARHAFADDPGGGSLCVPGAPGPCDFDCCNRCVLYLEHWPVPPFFLCGGHCNWNTDPCDGCEPGCEQEIIDDRDRGEYCPCGLL